MGSQIGNVWGETFLASLAIRESSASTDATFEGITSFDTVDIDLGEKDFEDIVLASGGRLQKMTPETVHTVTFEAWPLEVGSGDLSAATSITGFLDLLSGTEDTAQGYRLLNTTTRNRVRLALLWTDDSTVTNANAGLDNTTKAKRLVWADGWITAVKPTLTDGGSLKVTVTFKCSPFDSGGTSNVLMESVAGSGTITALASYTSTTKF